MVRYERPAGLLITFYVYIVYVIALRYEGYVLRMLKLLGINVSSIVLSPT